MIKRHLEKTVINHLKPARIVKVLGARRTGKTVLMQTIMQRLRDCKILYLTSDDLDTAELLASQRLSVLKSLVSGFEMLFIDEAQEIPRIGKSLKLIVDNIPQISIFITGSSALGIKEETGEPLTGRGLTFYLYPFAVTEVYQNFIEARRDLENLLVFGSYPQVFLEKNRTAKIQILNDIKNAYLLKDILQYENRKDSFFVLNLLRLIAHQIGHDVSLSELAKNLSVDKKTVARYLELLEKTFIIFSLPAFSRNMRKEITKSKRYYFWDNGIRNVLISNFNPLSARLDTGQLWENFIIAERIKRNHYKQVFANYYFWRTYDKKEIDFIEERDGHLYTFEFKYSKPSAKTPTDFLKTYPNSSFDVINRDNFWDFIN